MRRAGLLLLLTIALGVGCAAKKPPPPVIETQEAELGGSDSERPIAKKAPVLEPKTTAAPTPVDDDAAPKPRGGTASVGSTPVVKLLEPGKAPRKVAKHTFRTGSTQKLMMRSKTRVSGNLPVPTLTLDGPINVKITEVNGDGAGRFSLDAGPFKQGQSAPKGGGGLSGMLGGLLGGLGGGAASAMGGGPPEKIAGWGWVNPQGSVTEFHVTEGAGDDQAPVEVGDAFPTEPIGVGARWEVRVTIDDKDGPVEQTSTYQLVSFSGTTLKAKVKRVQVPASGSSSDDPGGGESEGLLTFHLGSLYATGKTTMQKALKLNLPGMDNAQFKMSSEVDIQKR